MLSVLGKTVSYTIRFACAFHVFSTNFYTVSSGVGESMLPTHNRAGDIDLVENLCRLGRNIKAGDVIVAKKPTQPNQLVCKRVIGMPGDYVLVDPTKPTTSAYIRVPQGHTWVTGDNLPESVDSRTYGPLPLALIVGKSIAAGQGKSFGWESDKNSLQEFNEDDVK